MARRKKNSDVREAMCERFAVAMQMLELSPSEMSRALGYANPTTIAKVLRGETFVDVERLCLFANLMTPNGKNIDLNWLITGMGQKIEERNN